MVEDWDLPEQKGFPGEKDSLSRRRVQNKDLVIRVREKQNYQLDFTPQSWGVVLS